MNFIIYIILGAAAGWLAGKIFKGSGDGFLVNTLVGIVGGFLGGWLLKDKLAFLGSLGGFLTAVLGAILLLFIVSIVRK